jgi:hypothetical protein
VFDFGTMWVGSKSVHFFGLGWIRFLFGFSDKLNLVFCLITGLKWVSAAPSIVCFRGDGWTEYGHIPSHITTLRMISSI